MPTPREPAERSDEVGIDDAERFVFGRIGAGDSQLFDVNQAGRRFGHLLAGVGRIVRVRGDRPDAVDLRHFERHQGALVLIEFGDLQRFGRQRILELREELGSHFGVELVDNRPGLRSQSQRSH